MKDPTPTTTPAEPRGTRETLQIALDAVAKARREADADKIREAELQLKREELAAAERREQSAERRANARFVAGIVLVLVLVLAAVAGVAGAVHAGAFTVETSPSRTSPREP